MYSAVPVGGLAGALARRPAQLLPNFLGWLGGGQASLICRADPRSFELARKIELARPSSSWPDPSIVSELAGSHIASSSTRA